MKIAIIGGSGRVGKRIVRYALERGHEVRTFNRRGDRSKMMNPGIETAVSGNYIDYEALAEFVKDADVVVDSTIHVRTNPEWLVPGRANVLKACHENGIKRVLFVGNHCTLTYEGKPLEFLYAQPIAFAKFIPMHIEAFNNIRKNEYDLDWTIVTPAAKMLPYGNITGKYCESIDDEFFLPKPELGLASSQISMEDFANFFVNEIENPRHIRQRVAICNPIEEGGEK
ncbi:NAD(P)-dependent oxidoreductase [Sinanaerobacter chloroacetimidivorans]|uniref:NAD(P)H-binding protein n=1 Tax=Sinanaerobacter chloroacetimidivorans TaxID=2818044 RepID=A0A8J8B2Z5_9FIRM|nr:NAD(P)H-binding protein [Sinanaerobacter chloroacetimidivorans]MBR0597775.1 NAD(P)H-binding protein [Sinanaerobacter chloroacetimidivorans]